jgi:hypothetical protein
MLLNPTAVVPSTVQLLKVPLDGVPRAPPEFTTEEKLKTPDPLVVIACPAVPSATGKVIERLLLVFPDCRVVVPVPAAFP